MDTLDNITKKQNLVILKKREEVQQQNKNLIKDVDPDVDRLKVVADHLLRISDKQWIFRYDLKKLRDRKDGGKRICILGGSGSGKSFLGIDILKALRHIPVHTIINPSESSNPRYGSHVPNESVVCDSEDRDEWILMLQKLKIRQRKRCMQWKIPNTDPIEYIEDPAAVCLLDDVSEDLKIFKDPIFRWLYANSRNNLVWLIHIIQYYTFLLPEYRRSLSHLFLARIQNINDMKNIWAQFFGMFEKFGAFQEAVNKASAKYRWLVVDILSSSTKLEDRVFFYDHCYKQPPFIVGAEWWHKEVNRVYDPEWAKTYDFSKDVTTYKKKKKTKNE